VTTESGSTARAASGGGKASTDRLLSELFYAHFAELTRLAMCLVHDQATAEDVVQDAYLALYRHHGRLRDPDKALTYLRSAVLNRARSHFRSLRRARAAKVLHLIPSNQTEDAVELREETDDVFRAVAALPQRQREVVVLRYYLELSEAEIADALGIAVGSVKRHAHRALAALTHRLEVQV
jgi:RNA polymerase sigma-70 factor (sigma-E family)